MSTEIQKLAESYSTFVSEAYNTLKDDILRAEYLLKYEYNIDILEYKPNQESLIQYYLLFENLESATKKEDRKLLLAEINNTYNKLKLQLKDAFNNKNTKNIQKMIFEMKMCRSCLYKSKDGAYHNINEL